MFPKWGRGYAKRLNNRVMRKCMNMALQNKSLGHIEIESVGILNFYFLDGTELGIAMND